MPWDSEVEGGDNIVLVNDSISIEDRGSVYVENHNADCKGSDDAGPDWACE